MKIPTSAEFETRFQLFAFFHDSRGCRASTDGVSTKGPHVFWVEENATWLVRVRKGFFGFL